MKRIPGRRQALKELLTQLEEPTKEEPTEEKLTVREKKPEPTEITLTIPIEQAPEGLRELEPNTPVNLQIQGIVSRIDETNITIDIISVDLAEMQETEKARPELPPEGVAEQMA